MMKGNNRDTFNTVSYLDVSEYIIKEPSPQLQPSPMQHHHNEVPPSFIWIQFFEEYMVCQVINLPYRCFLNTYPLLNLSNLKQILSLEDHFQLQSMEVSPSYFALTPVTSGLIRQEVQDVMDDFLLEGQNQICWQGEAQRRRGEKNRMQKNPIFELFKLDNDLERIVENDDEQSCWSNPDSIHSIPSEHFLQQDNCYAYSNTLFTTCSKKSQAKASVQKDIESQSLSTVEPVDVDYSETISRFNNSPALTILTKIDQVQASSSTGLFEVQVELKKYLEGYLLDFELFCYQQAWNGVLSMEKPFHILRKGIKETFQKKIGLLTFQNRRVKLLKYLEKKRRRIWKKKVSYDCRKKVADGRLRIKGKFVTRDQACEQLGLGNLDNYNSEQIKNMLQKKMDEAAAKQVNC